MYITDGLAYSQELLVAFDCFSPLPYVIIQNAHTEVGPTLVTLLTSPPASECQ